MNLQNNFWIPKTASILGVVVQSVRAPACHAGSCGFDSRQSRCPMRYLMTTKEKFASHLDILWSAIDRQISLDIEYPIIYNQMVRYFENKGVDFYGDVDEDYDILLTKLERELL